MSCRIGYEFMVEVATGKVMNDRKICSRKREKIHQLFSKVVFKCLIEFIFAQYSAQYRLLNEAIVIKCDVFMTSA